jgi:hypothetical protein
MTIAAVEAIARELAAVPGRKSLIWVSDRIQTPLLADEMDEQLQLWRKQGSVKIPTVPIFENRDDVERMIRVVSDAGIALYPVSAEGLETEDLGFRSAGGARSSSVDDLLARLPNPAPHQDMYELAKRTGGRAFVDRNDLETGIRRAVEDSRFTYELAYYPDHDNWKGEWRTLQVRVNRPGVSILTRGGYFALPDPRPLSPKSRTQFLSEIAASPLNSAQLSLTVHLVASPEPKQSSINATVHIDPTSMLVQGSDGHWRGKFEIVFIQLGGRQDVLDVTQSDVNADLDRTKYEAVVRKGWDMPAYLESKPGAAEICVVLRDKVSDKVGSVQIRLN